MGGSGPASLNTCCSGIVTHGNVFTVESSLLVVARLWSVCAEAGYENITTVCVTSFAVHNEILELLHNEPGLAEKVDKALFDACGRQPGRAATRSSTAATSSTATAPSSPGS